MNVPSVPAPAVGHLESFQFPPHKSRRGEGLCSYFGHSRFRKTDSYQCDDAGRGGDGFGVCHRMARRFLSPPFPLERRAKEPRVTLSFLLGPLAAVVHQAVLEPVYYRIVDALISPKSRSFVKSAFLPMVTWVRRLSQNRYRGGLECFRSGCWFVFRSAAE